MMIEFKNVSKKYGKNIVVDQLSLKINEGEIVSFIGESGCGKTTTLKMINGLVGHSSGEIFVDGIDIEKQNLVQLRRKMGYVIQQTGLFPHLSVRDNIELIPKILKYDDATIKAKTLELMDLVSLDPTLYLDRYPLELSGGQQQRIGVARAFATDPKIILMDEPFSALDPITREQLQDELLFMQSKLKKTIVFVTHDMDEAIKLADRICIMDKGKIKQFATPEEILKHPADEFVENFIGKKRIWNSPKYIKVKDIMIEKPITGLLFMSVFKAMEIMKKFKVDSLVIVDKNAFILGLVLAKDLQKADDLNSNVEKYVKKNTHVICEEESIVDVLNIVEEEQVSYLPVVDKENHLVGLITHTNLLSVLSQQFVKDGD